MKNKNTWSIVLDIFLIVSTVSSAIWGFMNEGIKSPAVIWGLVILAIWIIVMICSHKRRTKF